MTKTYNIQLVLSGEELEMIKTIKKYCRQPGDDITDLDVSVVCWMGIRELYEKCKHNLEILEVLEK